MRSASGCTAAVLSAFVFSPLNRTLLSGTILCTNKPHDQAGGLQNLTSSLESYSYHRAGRSTVNENNRCPSNTSTGFCVILEKKGPRTQAR